MAGESPTTLPTFEAYALWAETYPPRPHNALMESEQRVMAPLLVSVSPTAALDVGTGTGRNLALLAAAGARRIVGVDRSWPMLMHGAGCRSRVCADALRLPFRSRSFDVVCSSLMVGDIADPAAFTREAARLLKRGGHLLYSDFHPEWSAGNWRRTFRAADGRQLALDYFPHTLDSHFDALASAGLTVRCVREPRVAGVSAPILVLFHAVRE
jgi:malonyl-CoA O-methyltransferase